MSKTLFWYIFGNLLRIFFMTTGALAGMMSFAILLRPLTENGLDFGQVNRLLIYSLPAVCAYSLPISALFATTVVYGRCSADNELVAMRAGGISYFSPRRFSVALPALVLGLVVAVISMLMLCFIVPIYSLKVEEVIYSNIARVIANRIERTHALGFQRSDGTVFNVYADDARLVPADPAFPTRQRVELIGPAWMQYSRSPTNEWVMIPKEFWMARSAMVSIDRPSPSKPSMVTVELNDGIKFPRIFFGNVQAGVGSSGFGPFEIPSLINENVKFLDISRLAQLAHDPGQARIVQTMVRALIRMQQQQTYMAVVSAAIDHHAADGTSSFLFANDEPDSDTFEIGARDVTGQLQGSELVFTSPIQGDPSSIWMTRTHGSQQTLLAHAQEMRIRVQSISSEPTDADAPADRMNVNIELFKVALRTQDGIDTPRLSYSQSFSVPMPKTIRAIDHKTLANFLGDPVAPNDAEPDLHGPWRVPQYNAFLLTVEQVRANNAARSELHGRASFALSCLTLVMVGCALGVMFRSGNFLNAFAASFVPALLCITLVVSGQQMATHVSYALNFTALRNPLPTALVFIWSGNVIVLIAAIYLTVRLQRR
jgi:lipopolysaccharide export LptBFGC system permease protein LptF